MGEDRPDRRRSRPLSFEVRVRGVYRTGAAFNIARTRAVRLETAMLAVLDVGRLWAVQGDDVLPGTTVDLIDLRDGATIMSLRWNGFDPQELDLALKAFQDNGFQLKEVTRHGR